MDMVERVARAVAPMVAHSAAWWCPGGEWMNCRLGKNEVCECRENAFLIARAAIAAMREPTEGMVRAVVQYENDINGSPDYEYTSVAPESAWEIMIDAALTSSEK